MPARSKAPKVEPAMPPRRLSSPHVGHPAKNLGAHLKAPASGEIVTNHHRGAKKR